MLASAIQSAQTTKAAEPKKEQKAAFEGDIDFDLSGLEDVMKNMQQFMESAQQEMGGEAAEGEEADPKLQEAHLMFEQCMQEIQKETRQYQEELKQGDHAKGPEQPKPAPQAPPQPKKQPSDDPFGDITQGISSTQANSKPTKAGP